MFTKDDLTAIATLTKIPVETLEAAAKATEEVKLTLPTNLKSYTDTEIVTLGSNKYNEGKEAGVEMAVKEAREANGLTFEGKTVANLLAAHKTKIEKEAGKPVEQQVTELNNQINTLRSTNEGLTRQLGERETQLQTLGLDNEIIGTMPGVKADIKTSHREVLGLMKMGGYTFKKEADGVLKSYLNGQLQTDALGSPLPVAEVTKKYMTDKGVAGDETEVPIGRGKGPAPVPGAKVKTMTELKAQYTAAGKNLNGEEFMAAAAEAMKDKTFDANK